jgi:putative flippase GtrA
VPGSEPSVSQLRSRSWAERLEQVKQGDLVALFWELLRFGWVGLLTMALYAFQMWALGRLNKWPTWLNATVADGPCLLFNYLAHRSFSFRSTRRHREAGPRYLTVQLTGLCINSTVLWYCVDYMRWAFLPTQLGAIVVLALFSYTAQKVWSFKL